MKFDMTVERRYPHPIAVVWNALTTRDAIAEWLMESDFSPQVGHAFTMRCEDDSGRTDVFECRVLKLEPPTRMLWSWRLADRDTLGPTWVEFRAEAVEGGTLLRVRHYGDGDPSFIEVFESGWPGRLDDVARLLGDED